MRFAFFYRFSPSPHLLAPLTRGCALLACVGALLAQGCALEQRAEPLPAPLPLPTASVVPPVQPPPAKPAPARAARKASIPSQSNSDDASEAAAQPDEQGQASWYGASLHRRRTASGERFDMHALTAAHRSLPFGTQVCVRSLVNGKVVKVRINDRGPHAANRIIDLSHAAAKELDMLGRGTKSVALTVLEPEEEICAAS